MSEYQNETVTVMPHPHTGINSVSIHPCKHAFVMKNLIDKASENGGKIESHQVNQSINSSLRELRIVGRRA